MPSTFWGLVTAAVVVSVAHAALPSHWLPFVLVGKTQGWSARHLLAITALAAAGHVAITSLLGFLVAWVGIGLLQAIGEWDQPLIAGVLIATGGIYLVWAWRGGQGHRHFLVDRREREQEHQHEHEHNQGGYPSEPYSGGVQPLSDRAAFGVLFSVLTFSPCEGMVPFFFAATQFGWAGLLTLAIVTGVLTVLSILVWVSLARWGLERVHLPLSERGEKVLTGVVLMALGATILGWH